MRRTLSWLGATVFFISLAAGQVVPGRYIVELSGEPAAAAADARLDSKEYRRAALMGRRAAVRAEQAVVRASLQDQQIDVLDSVDTVANALVVHSPNNSAADLAAIPGVLRVHPVRMYKLYLDRAVQLQHVSDAWSQIGGMDNAGKGIKIGMIDTGIDNTHPGFQDASLPPVDGFPKVNKTTDTAYTNSKIIVARNYDRAALSSAKDTKGHGTSTSMVAAGVTTASPLGAITGIAPKAYLGSYKVFPDSSDGAPSDQILRAIDDAVADGMDVINMSLGSLPASSTSSDVLVNAVERATAAGVIVVIAAGNEGPDLNTIGSPGTAPSAITVGNSNNDRVFASLATLDGTSPYVAIPGSGPNSPKAISAQAVDLFQLDPTGLGCGDLPATSLTGKIVVILRGTCTFETKLNKAQAAGAIAALVYAFKSSPDPISMAAGGALLPAEMVSYADGSDILVKLHADPSLKLTLEFSKVAIPADATKLSGSSSGGPSVDASIKPDLLAVGTSILTADISKAGVPGYTIATGTSLSAPMVAGAAALLKAARPGLTASQYRSLLINSAAPFGSTLSVQQTGSGLLNMTGALQSTLAAAPASFSFGIGGGTVDVTRPLTLSNLGSTSETYMLSVAQTGDGPSAALSVDTVTVDAGKSQDVNVRFSAPVIGPGTYQGFILVRGTQSGFESRIPYWYGVPSEVARYVTVLHSPDSGNTGSRQAIFFRVTDSGGIPVVSQADVSVTSGDGTVISTDSVDDLYPGAFGTLVRLGPVPGPNVFTISIGGQTAKVTIQGK
jgi:minor extracellular serine protease Vpr